MRLADQLRSALAEGQSAWTAEAMQTRDPRIQSDIFLAPAAVLVAVTDRPEPGLILTERATTLRKHAGQVAFPGGRVDQSDTSEIAAALREAHEEIALPPTAVEIIGVSDRYHTFTGFDIVPVIGVVPPDLPLVPQAGEVESWFELPLAFALDPANRRRGEIDLPGGRRSFYEIMWQDHRIWGVTATILANLAKRLGYERANAA